MTTTGPLITLDRLRAFGARRQGLGGPGFASVTEAVLGTGGVYGSSPTCYLSLAARIEGFVLADLDRELYDTRAVVRLRAQRQMAYVQPVGELPMFLAAARPGPKGVPTVLRQMGAEYADYEAAANRVEAVMTGREPMSVAEIRAELDEEHLRLVVALMTRETRLVRTRPRGSWRSDGYGYARWSDWVGEPVAELGEAAARTDLARRYLSVLGPATPADLRWWAGWTAGETKAALAALAGETTPVRLQYPDGDAEALVLSADLPELEDAAPLSGVRLLPMWDAYPMGHKDRRRIVAPDRHGQVIDPVGNATSMILAEGEAAGVWQGD
ncbi:DNA glycosylase AlkZ-like family protein [Phytomonospora endophytica]|uniref:Winged helix DNA-binding domain-containing protein n=1 Tax=Phytomonospora endophytica TaxID=714109 RepID=A0A841F841_9ACTN|nr:crosslink repair DNA glycosylase YcaQ family protein [Phytomonospora endophytica]MBB6032386.1 hypothetical protein [Phytomonospora endophytica]GIG71400.1 hypothetical protein Pen01_76950 [Phytomonospora endophytica]